MDRASIPLALPNTDHVSAIAEFEQILASNSGEDPFDSAIRLLAAKLFDELNVGRGRACTFHVHKTPEGTHKAVQNLYRHALSEWPLLNGVGSKLDISPQHLVRSMRPLLGWQLCGSDLSWLDATLEKLVAKDAKGALGQYFTPREVVRFCVAVLCPHPKDRVIDPACGSGGFLFESTRYSLDKFSTAPSCLGIDYGARAIKVAALLAAATARAKITISKENSLDGRSYIECTPSEWRSFICRDVGAGTLRAQSWGAWNKLGCSLLLTNPPFAGSIDELDILDAYESQQSGSARNASSREHLFLERAVHLLKPHGRMAIVLPQGLFANPSASYLRSWLLTKCRIVGVVGLHSHAFLPHTSVKTSLLFAVKKAAGGPSSLNYPVFFATSQDCGKDSRGRPTSTSDYTSIAASFSRFLTAQEFEWAIAGPASDKTARFETVPLHEIIKADRLDAEFYEPEARSLLRKLGSASVSRLGSFVHSRPERFKKSRFKDIKYIDISSVDNSTGLTVPTVMQADEAPSRASYIVEPNDILVSTVRPERNVVAFVTGATGSRTVASNGFCVLRAQTVSPEVLFAYCKTEAFRKMITRHATASMYPTVSDRDILNVPFLNPPGEIADRVTKLIKSGLDMIEKAQQQIKEAITLMNDHIKDPTDSRVAGENAHHEAQQTRKAYRVKKKKR